MNGRDKEVANAMATRTEALNFLNGRGYSLREALDATRVKFTGKQPKSKDEITQEIREEIDRYERKIDRLKQELARL